MNHRSCTKTGTLRTILPVLLLLLSAALVAAQTVRSGSDLKPNGKGWGEEDKTTNNTPNGESNKSRTGSNGISYHGGPVMTTAAGDSTVNVYFIWYGNWSKTSGSDSQNSQNLLDTLFSSTGLNNSGYEKINTTYYDGSSSHVSGSLVLAKSANDNYSQGTALSDAQVQAVVSNAISNGSLPNDVHGLYFVLTSSDVNETSGFCTQYCGWHTHGTIGGNDVKYSFVGNPDRCPSACEAQTTSPNNNSGADGMASIMAHESEEAISDPDLNAWYDVRGNENADKCAWKWGPLSTASNGSKYNQTLGGYHWLIQMNWENASGGGCAQTYGGPFYTN